MCDIAVSDAIVVAPWTALSAVTSDTDGSPVDLGGVTEVYTMHAVVTGSPAAGTISLRGSLDGTNWYSVLTGSATNSNTAYTSNIVGTSDASLSSNRRPLVRHIRARLTGLSGGSSPTVTVNVAVGRIN